MGNPAYIKDSAGNWIELGSPTTDLSNYANLTTTPISGFRNAIINGGMNIWQRGTSIATGMASPYILADRWGCTRFGNVVGGTISRQTAGAPTGFQYYMRIQRDSGNTNTASFSLGQNIETANSIPFAGKTVTFSFYARAGANYSGSNITINISTGTGVDQNNFTGAFTGLVTLSTTVVPTTSWTRYTFTATIPSNVTQFMPGIYTSASGTAGAADYIDVTGFQFELGSIATPFEQRPIGTELALCQRYYQKSTPIGVAVNSGFNPGEGSVQWSGANYLYYFWPFKVPMRTTPTSHNLYDGAGSAGKAQTFSGASFVNGTAAGTFARNENGLHVNLYLSGSIIANANLEASAEL